MFKIIKKEVLNKNVTLFKILAPLVAKKAKPGQFIIFRLDKYGERIPLTIADYSKEKGTVTIIVQSIGKSTARLSKKEEGEYIQDFVGPLGEHTKFGDKIKRVAVVGGGVGCAIVFPQAKYLHSIGVKVDIIAGFKDEENVILEKAMKNNSTNLYITTDDGSKGTKGFVTTKLEELIKEKGKYDLVITIGPLPMMKFICDITEKYNIKTIVSLNAIMIDGTGMCGCCRVKINGETKFACVEGPDFDGHKVDFDELIKRNGTYKEIEEKEHKCNLIKKAEKYETNMANEKVKMPEQEGKVRNKNFLEVCLGYDEKMAMEESSRCLQCKTKPCIKGCPVKVMIPEFINEVALGNFEEAYKIITKTNSLPSISGRVCPQETQCEEICVRGIKGESVAIGRLERFVADWYLKNISKEIKRPVLLNKKVAVVGGGPSGLICASSLVKKGYSVTLFETFHEIGGVLVYGIPEFRLPNEIVENEVKTLKKLGVEIRLNTLVGKTITIEEMLDEGFEGIYLGTGGGLPKFMEIEGEGLIGVFSANEYLTRINSMKAHLDEYDTTLKKFNKTAVIGGGNVAMDASRCAIRAGSKEVCIIYRRDEENMPARKEEIHHAKEEEIEFYLLTNPVKILGNEDGEVIGIECVKMELGEEDSRGRRTVKEIENSNFVIEVDSVIVAIGTNPNPLISKVTKGLDINSRGCVIVDDIGKTALDKVYAGGDLTAGTSTVIYAMGCGKKGAESIHKMLKEQKCIN